MRGQIDREPIVVLRDPERQSVAARVGHQAHIARLQIGLERRVIAVPVILGVFKKWLFRCHSFSILRHLL